jgi:RND superfamily putative drug exporter
VLARPVLAGLATALALAPLAQGGLRAAPSFELELDLPESSVSEAGFAALVRSFEASAVQTLTLAVEAGAGAPELRSTAGLDALHALAEWLAAQPAIARVYGATRPTGEAGLLARGSLGSQLHELATGLARAEDGARELAGGIAAAERGVRTGRTEIAREREKLESEQRASLLGVFAPGRFEDAEQRLAGMESKLGELEAGLARAALGADALRAGIGRGRERLAAVTAAPGAAALLARPLLTPDDLSANAELGRALAYYLSEDSRAARFELVLADPPNSPAAVAALARLRSELQVLLPALGFGRAHFAGATPITLDLAALTQRDLATLSIWIALGIFALLVLLLRELAAPAAITALILLSYFAALGALDFAVRAGLWPGLDWKAPFFLFVLLVAIGADYGVFVLGRAREERRAQEFEPALVGALVATGPVVTSCGVVLAGTFAALTLSRIAFLEQVGLGITVGVLIDTGLVRPFLLPAVAIGLERARSR